MASFGDFSSLLQLGVGTGVGLSLFRAPVDLRVARISRTIEAELVALRGVTMPFAQRKRRDMLDLKLRFVTVREALDRSLMPFMIAAVIGAFLNLLALIAATMDTGRALTPCQADALIFLSVGWFLMVVVALEVLARLKLQSINRDLRTLRQKRATSIQIQSSPGVPVVNN